MITPELSTARLLSQHITVSSDKTPADVVAHLGAVQAQDFAQAMRAIGIRGSNCTYADVEQAMNTWAIVRTRPMRGTLHFVAAADARRMTKFLGTRVLAKSTRRSKQLDLDEEVFSQCRDVFAKALAGRQHLTRNEMKATLEDANISTSEQRWYHILRRMAQEGLICLGPIKEKEQAFVLVDEWISDKAFLKGDEALAEITRRYFTSHGPATIQDFVWRTWLTVSEVKKGIELVWAQLTSQEIHNKTYRMSASLQDTIAWHIWWWKISSQAAYLLPGFDEFMLGYKDRSATLDPKYANLVCPWANGMFKATIVVNGETVGTRQRTPKKDKIEIMLHSFDKLAASDRALLEIAVQRYALFSWKEILLTLSKA